LIILTRNNIRACWALGRSILALKANSEIFEELLNPILDAKLGETIVGPIFNLDDNSPIQKLTKISLDYEYV
jgi:hypothetical protein